MELGLSRAGVSGGPDLCSDGCSFAQLRDGGGGCSLARLCGGSCCSPARLWEHSKQPMVVQARVSRAGPTTGSWGRSLGEEDGVGRRKKMTSGGPHASDI